MFKKLLDFLAKRQHQDREKLIESVFREKRKSQRFLPQFEIDLLINGMLSRLLNISVTGGLRVGLIKPDPLPEQLELQFSKLDTVFKLQGVKKWQKSELAGVRIIEPGVDFVRFIKESLTPQFLGETLYEIQCGLKIQAEDEKLRWWQGKGDTNVFLWEIGRDIQRMQIVFMDYILEWHQGFIKVGELKGGEASKPGYGRVDPQFIVFYNIPKLDILDNALTLVRSSKMDSEIKDFIIHEIMATERRLLMRFVVENVFLLVGEKRYTLTELSYEGFQVEEPFLLFDGTGTLVFEEAGFECPIRFRLIHHSQLQTGFRIENLLSNKEKYQNYLRKLATSQPQ
ncbi:MAG: hypothetical protein PHW04_00165 [Candidatus Wallbacteria bacterium]|nr:hypothetical protein [Candidatus Wallbacteria bacterium]